MAYKKKLFVITGGEGSGKTTLINNLKDKIKTEKIVYTNDPNKEIEECIKLRELLLSEKYNLSKESELLLFMAARKELIDKIINPALEKKYSVITDRFDLDTWAYQQIMSGHQPKDITYLSKFINTPRPSCYIYLDIDPEVGLKRSKARLNDNNIDEGRFENMNIDKHKEIRNYFLACSEITGPESGKKTGIVEKIDVENLTPEEVLKEALTIFNKYGIN